MSGLREAPRYPDDGTAPYVPRGLTAPVNRFERFRATGRFGDLWAPQLSAILYKLDQGYLDDWADLVEFAIGTDPTLASLYETRIDRVTQASWQVKPSKLGDPAQAKLAAEFCDEQLRRIPHWNGVLKWLLHGLFVGFSAAEMEWDYDADTDTNYVRKVTGRHTHRFRYDERWIPRLYDFGQRRSSVNAYGEALDPRRWITFAFQCQAGYPNVAGLFRPAAWTWLFSRWADKFLIQSVEKFGAPFVYAVVAQNTPPQVRDEIKQGLEDLTADHVAVIEQGGEIIFKETSISTSGAGSLHGSALDRYEARLGKLILGASDIADPGAHGSQAAVDTRGGMTADPRMVADGILLGESVSSSLFYWLLQLNAHKFADGIAPPVPTYEAKTASDEVDTDSQDLAEQNLGSISSVGALDDSLETPAAAKADVAGDTAAAAAAQGADKAADTALNGAQVQSLLDIVTAVATGQLPRDAAAGIIKRAFNMDDQAALEALGSAGNGFVPTPTGKDAPAADTAPALTTVEASPPNPKAMSRSSSGRRKKTPPKKTTRTVEPTSTTSPTSSRSQQILAGVLRDASADRRRS